MAKNSFLKKSDWVSFTVNFLAVVLGIAITFICEGIISRHGERQRAKEILTLMRDELVGDIEGMDNYSKLCEQQAYAIDYLLEHSDNVKSIPDDSLRIYGLTAANPMLIVMNNIAAELLHSDDFQNGIKDNKLKLAIAEAYVLLDGAVESYNLRTHAILDGLTMAENENFRRKVGSKDASDREFLEELYFSPDGLFNLKQCRGRQICETIASTNAEVKKIIERINMEID